VSEVVIDTNVWCMPEAQHDRLSHLECAETCHQWLKDLSDGNCRVAVDDQWVIMSEYRNNIPKRGFADLVLSRLQQTGRIVGTSIEFDADGRTAVLPPTLGLDDFDPNDKKFVAVALARDPHPPIYNAVDSDWQEHAEAIAAADIRVEELCPDILKDASGSD
jgi:hypothetical protein